MRPLNELVTIDTRFRKSVNLQLDLGDNTKVLEYIPTKSSVSILKRYLKNVQGYLSENANILIGPYGKGKSHLILVLLAILKGQSRELMPLPEKLERIDPETADVIKQMWKEQRRFLPVLVSTTGKDLNASFLQALREALIRAGLSALAPDSYYSEAEKNITVWKTDYPDTYHQFVKLAEEKYHSISEFTERLRRQDREALQFFTDIYPNITAGSIFQPMLRQEALQIYREINRKICQEHHYSGIYIVFDEFSKYMEGHTEENFANNMKVLQDICELANNGGDEKLFLTLIAHKSIHEYGKSLSSGVRNAFRGVEGRLKEIRFVVSAQNNYELIADTILKKEPDFTAEYKERMQDRHIRDVIERSYELTCFRALFERSDYEEIIAKGCFPLTPLCAYALFHLSEKIAQNERTIFTFLTNDESGSLVRILRKSTGEWIGVDAVYDYFKSLFRESADMPQIHNEWLKADYGLSLAENRDQEQIIKAVAVIRMIHREDELPAQDEPVRLSVGMAQDEYRKAMKGLMERGVILYRASLGMYAFKNNVGVDVETEIKKEAAALSKGFQICESLSRVSELQYVIPRKYNQKHAMTRYFRYEYMAPEAFLALEQGNYLFEHGFSDGKIIALISEKKIDIEAVREHAKQLGEPRILVSVPARAFSQTENLKKLAAVRALMENEGFLEENRVLLQELKLYEEDLLFEINASLEVDVMPEQGDAAVIYLGEKRTGFTAAGFNQYLSDILEAYYEHTPRVNHELLNIQNVTGQYLRARNQVVDAVLHGEDCSRYLHGTAPEAMVYRAAFVRTGLVGCDIQGAAGNGRTENRNFPLDSGIARVLEEIDSFFMDCGGQKQFFTKLYEKLQGRHFGVRKGILPLCIVWKLSGIKGMAVIYLGEKELEIDAEVLNRVNQFPDKYQLYIEPESLIKEQYLRKLEKLFCESEGELFFKNDRDHFSAIRQNRLSRITQAMQKWYRALPQYAMVTTELPEQHLEAAKVLRACLRRAEINPRELLMERLPAGMGSCNTNPVAGEKPGGKESSGQEPADLSQNELLYAAETLETVKKELESAPENLKGWMAAEVRAIFQIREDVSLKGSLKEWYRKQQKKAGTSILSTNGESLMHFLEDMTTNDEAEIMSQLSKVLLDIYLEDWNDAAKEHFSTALVQVKEEIEGISEELPEASGKCQIILKDASGRTIEKFYDSQEDSTTAFLKNMIDEALEDFGESLETNQKVAVLIKSITELLGDKDE